MKEPKLGETFWIADDKNFGTANKEANELGLMAQIEFIIIPAKGDHPAKGIMGKWVKHETSTKRP